MSSKTRIADLPEFDMARQLKSEEDIAAYVTMVIAVLLPECYKCFKL